MRRALLLLLLLAACDEGGGAGERSLRRLERLGFVPPGECVLARAARAGIDCSNERPLLVDRFEVTRGEWRAWIRAGAGGEPPPPAVRTRLARWAEGSETLPASWMSLEEARRFAAAEDMRLPTAAEWMRVAAGTRSQRLPWGAPARSVANSLELGLGRPAPVGTFENGQTTLGVHDLVGNVAEWVEGTLLEPGPSEDGRTWAMGGSYLSRTRELFQIDLRLREGLVFNAQLLDREHRATDLGARLCADAERYLAARAGGWPRDRRARERLTAVGRRWGRAAVPLLEGLAGRKGAAPGLADLLAGARR